MIQRESFLRLADFIIANVEPILTEWEIFARTIWPHELVDSANDPARLRDHAEDILRAAAQDMASDQTAAEQSAKSKGGGGDGADSVRVNRASKEHGVGRARSGFELWAVIAEYRALRATVIRLWGQESRERNLRDLDDLTRFNESIDQSLAESVRNFAEGVDRERAAALVEQVKGAQELREINEALLISSVRQQEMTEEAHRAAAELRDAKEEAETANRAKDMFLATLSHEMRTPLSAIVGWIHLLRRGNTTGQARDEVMLTEGLAVIDRSTKAQLQLIEDVLDVSRIVSGKLRMEIKPCDMAETIKAAIDAVRPAAEARDITLSVRLDPLARKATCDATRIQQVVWNLVSNAVKFTPKGGKVSIELDREHASLCIRVTDSGQGISPELLPFVFDRFRQADSSTRRKFGGLGLGLSIVKHLTEMHGGTVEAQSAGDGSGATFIVRLPIRAVRMDEDPDDEPRASAGDPSSIPDADGFESAAAPVVRLDGLHILIVDDEPDARRMMAKLLEGAGAIVTAAEGASDALAALAREKPDLLVSDLGMPDQDGFDLIRQIRAGKQGTAGHHPRDLPAVALTAFVHKEDRRQALLAGFQVHVPKPVDPHDLTAVIASLTGRTGTSASTRKSSEQKGGAPLSIPARLSD